MLHLADSGLISDSDGHLRSECIVVNPVLAVRKHVGFFIYWLTAGREVFRGIFRGIGLGT